MRQTFKNEYYHTTYPQTDVLLAAVQQVS